LKVVGRNQLNLKTVTFTIYEFHPEELIVHNALTESMQYEFTFTLQGTSNKISVVDS